MGKEADIKASRVELREHVADLSNAVAVLSNCVMEGDKAAIEEAVGKVRELADSVEGEGDHLVELLDEDE